jgi:salicylate hydroxylase
VTRSRTVVVAGAGIGGLTASLALAAKGFRVLIIETAERLEEAGAGLQLSPNASRILIGLGLHARLSACALVPDAISIMSARHGGEICRLPLGEAATSRAGAPYWVVHRADLQAALLEQVGAHPDIELRLGAAIENATAHTEGVTVNLRGSSTDREKTAWALIGADGVWSALRTRLFPDADPLFSGLIAWRGTIEATQLPHDMTARHVQLWMGPDAHLVAYPMSGGRQINIVAVMPDAWNQPGWSAPGDAADIKRRFAQARWSELARRMIDAVDGWRKWALFTIPPMAAWHCDAMALLGDAAHAMLPFAAQGAGMAIEDAAVLAQCLGDATNERGDGAAAALARYTGLRRARVARVQKLAQLNGRIYHLGGAAALARDLAIRTMGPQRMLARQDWIYKWRP